MTAEKLARPLFSELEKISGGPFASRPEIIRLRRHLTDQRAHRLEGYMNEPSNFSAYLSYYLPQHLPELFWILDQCRTIAGAEVGRKTSFPTRFVDIGSGPGTATLSALLWMKDQGAADRLPNEITLIDQSKRALQTAKQLIEAVGFDGRIEIKREHFQRPAKLLKQEFRSEDRQWLFLSHVLNEFGNGPRFREKKLRFLDEHVFPRLGPQDLLFIIEPPLREPTMDLMRLRDLIAKSSSFSILAPCPYGTLRCPLAAQKKGWCYAQPPRTWARAKGLAPWDRQIEKALTLKLERMGFSYLVVQNANDVETKPHSVHVSNRRAKKALMCEGPRGLRERFLEPPFRGAFEFLKKKP